MIGETIARIEKELKSNSTLSADQRRELLELVANLKNEIEALSDTHSEDAKRIAKYTEASFLEAIRGNPDPEALKRSLDGMSFSVKNFEVSHPTLVGVINTIGQTLWHIGI